MKLLLLIAAVFIGPFVFLFFALGLAAIIDTFSPNKNIPSWVGEALGAFAAVAGVLIFPVIVLKIMQRFEWP